MIDSSKFVFDENLIKERLLPLNSNSRLALEDDCFIKSAILFLLMPYADRPYDLILIRRTKSDKDKHSGEMGFPGGKVDKEDSSLKDTALRECEEELGIPRGNITILGSFDDHITPKGFIITPVVGYIDEKQVMKKEISEVQDIVKIPVDFFANKKNYRERTYDLKGEMIAVGKFTYRAPNGTKYVVFGATSHIIVHFIDMIYKTGLLKSGARRLTCSDIRDKIVKR